MRCGSLDVENTEYIELNTKEVECWTSRLQIWLHQICQNKITFSTATPIWDDIVGADTSSRSKAIKQNKKAAVCLWRHESVFWGNTEFLHVSLWWIELITIDYLQGHWRSLRKVCTKLLRELKTDLHLPIPTDISCLCRAQWLSGPPSIGVCRRSRGWVAAARQLLIGPFDLWPGYVRSCNERDVPWGYSHYTPSPRWTSCFNASVLPQTAALKRSQYLHVPHTRPTGRF